MKLTQAETRESNPPCDICGKPGCHPRERPGSGSVFWGGAVLCGPHNVAWRADLWAMPLETEPGPAFRSWLQAQKAKTRGAA